MHIIDVSDIPVRIGGAELENVSFTIRSSLLPPPRHSQVLQLHQHRPPGEGERVPGAGLHRDPAEADHDDGGVAGDPPEAGGGEED